MTHPHRHRPPDYRIALRPYDYNEVGEKPADQILLDDIVVNDVVCFRMEDMGEYFWIGCYLGDGTDPRICFTVRRGKRKKGEPPVVVVAREFPDVKYEEGGVGS